MSRLGKLDRYVIKRHSEIYPPEEHLSGVLKLVSDVEEVMKQVSQEWNKAPENDIKIEGLVRVGDLSKGLLLATDKSVSLVLLCISPPTKSMLQNVHVQVRSRIKEVDSDYDTLLLEKEAAFAVSKSQRRRSWIVLLCDVHIDRFAQESRRSPQRRRRRKGGGA